MELRNAFGKKRLPPWSCMLFSNLNAKVGELTFEIAPVVRDLVEVHGVVWSSLSRAPLTTKQAR